jgi:folate-binding protein YgfZ
MSKLSPLHEMTERAGAMFADDSGWSMPREYGDAIAEYNHTLAAASLFDTSNRGEIQVSGKDAASFLHNLSTNDILGMPLGAGCEAFFCNPKAKVIGHALIYHVLLGADRHAFWLDTAAGQSAKLAEHLNRYLIGEDVEITDRTEEFCQVHLAGPRATAVLARALADDVPYLDPLLHMERTFGVNVTAHIRRHDPLGVPGYDIVCLSALAPGLWRMLTESGAKPAGLDAYELLRVEAGTPVYGKDITEERFAFDVGRTAQAVSYAKGCYLGQEPIVMARDRAGHAPRTLLGLKLTGNAPVESGAKVAHGGEEVGYVTSSVNSPRLGRAIALAYLRHGHQEPGTVVEVRSVKGSVAAEVSALPLAGPAPAAPAVG